jgi:hypothetical protein
MNNHRGVVAVVCLLLGGACAPQPKTVANVSIGNTGCPAQDLAVFDYVAKTRSWRAVCHDTLYVCSDVRDGTRCTKQATVDPEVLARGQLLIPLRQDQRDRFIESKIMRGDWEQFSASVVAISKLSESQTEKIEDGTGVVATFPEAFARRLGQCANDAVMRLEVEADGTLKHSINPWMVTPADKCFADLTDSPELAWLRQHPGEVFFLPTGIFGVHSLPHPKALTVAAADPPESAVPASDAAVTEQEDAVRAWLNTSSAEVLSCTGEPRSVVIVNIDSKGAAQVALRGALAGKPEERCVRAALGKKQFAPGPLEVIHLINSAATN